MFITKIMVICDECKHLLPGIDEDWLACTFPSVDIAVRQARSKGWQIWEKFNGDGNLEPTGKATCPTCKGK